MAKNGEFIGTYFNLMPIFRDLNQRFFHDKITARVRWGRRRSFAAHAKCSIRLGSYSPSNQTIIINPCLDQASVPLLCLERILFHEMLHQHLPAKKSSRGRSEIHHRQFKDFEKSFPHLKEADLWIAANLTRLLKY